MHNNLLPILAALFCAACGPASAPPPETVRLVKVLEISAQARNAALALPGEVRARHESPVAFRVAGKVVERHVNLGDSVGTGQVLARIEATDYALAARAAAAAATAARADFTFAESELARHRSLVEKGYVSSIVLDQKVAAADAARARLKAAEAEQAEADRQVQYTTLTADAAGVVTALDLQDGQVVAAGQTVLRIARDGDREIEIHVPEAELARIRAAQGFRILLNAQPGNSYDGTLRELAAAADPLTRTYAARIALATAAAPLQLGMSATVSDVQDTTPVLRLPLSAVVSRDGRPQVWKLDAADSTVHAVDVRTGGLDGDGVLIEAGIAPGDVIVSAGANLLREGQPVRTLR